MKINFHYYSNSLKIYTSPGLGRSWVNFNTTGPVSQFKRINGTDINIRFIISYVYFPFYILKLKKNENLWTLFVHK